MAEIEVGGARDDVLAGEPVEGEGELEFIGESG